MIPSADYEKVEFFLSCRSLKDLDFVGKSDPQVKMYLKVNGNWSFISETETLKDNLNPDFKKTIIVDFIFETQQELKFEVWDIDKSKSDDFIGSAETSVGAIMGSRKQTVILDLIRKNGKNSGKLIAKGERSGNAKNHIFWQWSGEKLMNTHALFDKSDPVLKFLKVRPQGDTLLAHETEFCKKNLNPLWKMCKVDDDKLCSGKHSQVFRIECWDHRTDKPYKFMGSVDVTLDQIKGGQRDFTLINPKKKNAGTLRLLQFSIEQKFTLIDYLRSGLQLNLIGAIDFTQSNGAVTKPDSLHAINPNGAYNEYQNALHAVGQILLNYDYDQLVPMYGFGGKPKFPGFSSPQVSHCFPCTGNPTQPQVSALPGIMQVYQHALLNVDLSGPTMFAPLIKEAAAAAQLNKMQGTGIYNILLILTDGEIHDMNETVDNIVASAFLPLSIIIIGVGKANFGNMKVLDGDEGLTDSKGTRCARDLVQFVAYREFKDLTQLAREVLFEIPDQVVGYMTLTGQKPTVIAQ